MKKIISFVFVLFFSILVTHYQIVVKIWNKEIAPVVNGLTDEAELIIYTPPNVADSIKNPAVLICPGGGYAGLSMQYEGHAFAKWLASNGFVGIILKYRLPNKRKEVPFDDADKALQIIRENAENWKINLNKLGVAGFSAGGHLAAILSNKLSSRGGDVQTSFTILFYPVISFKEVTKGGTRNNLLDINPSALDIMTYSAEMQVTENTSPTILFTCDGDDSVPPTHSLMYYDALKNNNVPASLYVFPQGSHGWAMLENFKYTKDSLTLLGAWLERFK